VALRNDECGRFYLITIVILLVVVLVVGKVNLIQAAGTSIPVSKGGTGGTSPYEALVNLLPSYAGNEGKVLGLSGGTPAWRGFTDLLPAYTSGDNGKVLGLDSGEPAWLDGSAVFVSPDYDNMEVDNKITTFVDESVAPNLTYTGKWKAAASGFVKAGITVPSNTPEFGYSVAVNGVIVNSTVFRGSGTAKINDINTVWVAVKQDDEIKVASNLSSGHFIYFIPPKYSRPPTPIVVEGGDYSPAEQPVMVNDNGTLRAKLWTDRKPIYQKTIDFSFASLGTASQFTIGTVASTIPDAEKLVDATVVSNGSSVAGVLYYLTPYIQSVNLIVQNDFPSTLVNMNITMTVWYTKTTDAPSP
jgi:hypothetical protein